MLLILPIFLVIATIITTTLGQQGFVNDVKARELYISKIYEGNFEVYWYSAEFSSAQDYTVTLNKIDACNATDYDVQCRTSRCSFTLSEYCDITSPCTDVTVKLTANGLSSEGLQFNTAPFVSELQNMTFEINGSVGTVTWNSESANSDDSRCATRAKVKIKVNGITQGKPEMVDTVLGQTNNISLNLDPCDVGAVDAFITYVSGQYDTNASYLVRADHEFPVGIENPPVTGPGDDNCSIQVSWYSVCNKVDNYLLTWDDGEGLQLDNTKHTILELKPGNSTACVTAYSETTPIGETFCNDYYVEQVSPGVTKIDKLVSDNYSNEELTVIWTGPETHGCAVVDGFQITWQKLGEGSISGTWNASSMDTNYTITGLKPCSLYEVKVEAFSNIGKGLAGYMNASTQVAPDVMISDASSTSLSIKWDYVSSEGCQPSKFIVKWWSATNGEEKEVSSDYRNYTIENLTCMANYNVSVKALLADGAYAVSDPVTETTTDQVPGQIQILTVSGDELNPTHLSVSWSEAPYECLGGLQSYKLSWEVDGKTYTNNTDASCNKYTITGLQGCTTYQVTVVGVSSVGEGPKKMESGQTSLDSPAEPVPSIEANSSTPSSLLVSWRQEMINQCPITKYQVKWSSNIGRNTSGDIESSNSSYTITGLICNTNYNVIVTAYTSDDKYSESDGINGTTVDKGSGVSRLVKSRAILLCIVLLFLL